MFPSLAVIHSQTYIQNTFQELITKSNQTEHVVAQSVGVNGYAFGEVESRQHQK